MFAADVLCSACPCRVRLHLPDGTLLQSDFKATDALSRVQVSQGSCSSRLAGMQQQKI